MVDVDLHPNIVDNLQMGYLFEELVRRFNEEAGDHFTPREVTRLMANLIYTGESDVYTPGIYRTIYDPTCGTGGMLSVSETHILDQNDGANLGLFGQEYNDESWAICCSDMLIKDEETNNIIRGDTLGDGKTYDGHSDKRFHYMLANPPFGVEWKDQKTVVEKEHKELGFSGRFGAGLPPINDGSLLFLQHMLSKRHPSLGEGGEGSKIAIVFNGSPLFSGDAGSGPSNIRRWIIENDWLDAIVALPDFGRIKNGTMPASGEAEYWDGDVLWAAPEDLGKLTGDRISSTKRQVTVKAVAEINLSVLPVGSVIISTRAPIGHMAINDTPMSFNQGCRGIIPGNRVHGPFLYYLLKSRAPELSAMANGTTFVELSRDELAAVQVAFPNFDSQRRIADFLDERMARIDELITKKERLLELLADKRQALITRAVTKGLDPNAPMKHSGIDWLGDIPAHWEIKKLRHLSDLELGLTYLPADVTPDETGVRVLRASNIVGGRLVSANDVYVNLDVPEALKLKGGDVLICSRSGSRDLIGKNAVVTPGFERDTFGAFMTVLRSEQSRYLQLVLSSDILSYQSHSSMTSTINQLTLGMLKGIVVPCPPFEERNRIVELMTTQVEAVDCISEVIQCSITLLRENRSALITAAVTGQIDVEPA